MKSKSGNLNQEFFSFKSNFLLLRKDSKGPFWERSGPFDRSVFFPKASLATFGTPVGRIRYLMGAWIETLIVGPIYFL